MDIEEHAKDYSEDSLWKKLRGFAKTAGREIVEKVLALYEALKDEDTPAWAKGTIVAALGYFIAPVDAIPDLLPAVGFSDDLGALAVALGAVAAHVKEEHLARAREIMKRWFPESEDED